MPAKPKKSKGNKGGGADQKVRKYLEKELDPWVKAVGQDIANIRRFICDIEAVVFRPGSPQALAAGQHCTGGGTIDGNPPPPQPPPKFK
jgi:hypothetical protein